MQRKIKFFFLFLVVFLHAYPSEKTLVVSTKNGLCNRLRSIASGYVLAQHYDRSFKVLWTQEGSYSVGYTSWNDLFDSPPLDLMDEFPKNGAFFGKKEGGEPLELFHLPLVVEKDLVHDGDVQAYGRLRGCRRPGSEVWIDIPSSFSQVTLQAIQNIRPSEMSAYEFYNKKREFYKLLIPKRPILEEIDRFAKNFTEKTIGVHIRAGDLLENRWKKKEPSYLNFEIMMRKCLKEDRETIFFLCSDSYEVISYFKRSFPRRILTYDQNRFKQDKIERFSVDGTKNALIELFLLSKTKKLIGTKFSSFSYEAATLGGIDLIEIAHD